MFIQVFLAQRLRDLLSNLHHSNSAVGFIYSFCTALWDISWCTKGYINKFDLIWFMHIRKGFICLVHHDPSTARQSWWGHDKTYSPAGDWKDLAWVLRSSKHPDGLHHCLVWQLLGLRPQGTTEGSAYGPVNHRGQTSCHAGPLYQAVS
jgi:hypothetical protein